VVLIELENKVGERSLRRVCNLQIKSQLVSTLLHSLHGYLNFNAILSFLFARCALCDDFSERDLTEF